jgi:hypothetical protein
MFTSKSEVHIVMFTSKSEVHIVMFTSKSEVHIVMFTSKSEVHIVMFTSKSEAQREHQGWDLGWWMLLPGAQAACSPSCWAGLQFVPVIMRCVLLCLAGLDVLGTWGAGSAGRGEGID